jgi:hypothetical protein
MSIPGAGSPLFLSAAAAEAAAYQIDRSIRINDDDTAYLNRTPSSAGNLKTWTWSAWVKRGKISEEANLFSVGASSTDAAFRFNTDDTLQVRDGGGGELTTNAVFRDPSAWYHIVVSLDTTQSTAADRFKVYINGAEQTYSASAYASQNADGVFNTAVAHYIGRQVHNTSNLFDGYLTEIHFVDGTQLAASDFGEYDDNNVWQPKEYSGSYGTNGFKLDFSDNTSTTTIAEDSSGNNNDWTTNNISVSSGSGNDSLIDTPTNYTPGSGNPGGNYATFSPIDSHSSNTFANGNLEATNAGVDVFANLTMGFTSGKWYCEIEADGGGSSSCMVGIVDLNETHANRAYGNAGGFYMYQGTGGLYSGGLGGSFSNSSYGSSYSDGDIIGIGLDMDNGNVRFYINGSDQGQANTSSLAGALVSPAVNNDTNSASFKLNTGQRPFSYTPPTGHKAMCTTNFADPTIADGSTAMDVVTYSGDGTNGRAITGINHSPDLVWIKARNQTDGHNLFDIVRGTTKVLKSNNTNAELTESNSLTAFNSDGFTVGNNAANAQVNQSGFTYVGWTWDGGTSTVSNTDGSITSNVRANQSAGFSICTYTGNGTANSTVGHGLNAAPSWIIIRNRDQSPRSWMVLHTSAGLTGTTLDGSAEYKMLKLESTNAAADLTNDNIWDPTSTTFKINGAGTGNSVNYSGDDYVAYCWAPVAGFSSFGSYTGNASSSGPFVFTGFRPKFLLMKNADDARGWYVVDSERNEYNPTEHRLHPDTADTEAPMGESFDFLSNGFKVRATGPSLNGSGNTHIYAAFAENPFQANGGLAR